MRYVLFLAICFFIIPSVSFGQPLEETKIYRLDISIHDLKRVRDNASDPSIFAAGKNSSFVIVDATHESYYVIRFLKINIVTGETSVTPDELYKLQKKYGFVGEDVDISKSVKPVLSGPTSGPLIVPFKYRLDDENISGEAAIGYYAGYSIEIIIPKTEKAISFSPIIAGGLSQINIAVNGKTETKTGVTWAAGLLIQNWANVNIGLVYGQDRIGNSNNWEHEGQGWVSIMVGWNI